MLKRVCKQLVALVMLVSLFLGTITPPAIALNFLNRKAAKASTTVRAETLPFQLRDDLPLPDPEFNGVIEESYVDSTADQDIMKGPTPPEGAPNVLLVLLDDVGFAASHAFGGEITSPALDALVENGLSYNRFHTTALCAPTRAALLTGRNHHSAAAGNIAEHATGFPGYSGLIPQSTATIAQILQAHGYSTSWFGKNHNAPDNQTSMVGPFNRMPNDLGFDYFYGFNAGETDQWYPTLYENRNPIEAPGTPPEYNLTRDLADQAINWIGYHHSLAPDVPFFLYFAPGATHAPHQPPQEYVEHYGGMFTDGWDALHERICDRLINGSNDGFDVAGLIPAGTTCTDRPQGVVDSITGEVSLDLHADGDTVDLIPAWDDLDTLFSDSDSPFYLGTDNDYDAEQAKDLLALQMQNYAGFFEYTDKQVERIIKAIEDLGLDDNTLIMYIVGDNGASAEGGFPGTCNEFSNLNGIYPNMEENLDCLARIQENTELIKSTWGGTTTSPHYAVGWAWALDTPFRWTKKIASYFGGTRNPMVVYWKGHIEGTGDRATDVREQFLHAIDVVPTLLEIIGIAPPANFNGIEQKPIEGASFVSTFDSDGAQAPSPRDTQYFEMYANRGVYKKDEDGKEWMASTIHQQPWTGKGIYPFEPDSDPWELFRLDQDFTQANDLSETNSDQLDTMKQVFDSEAKTYDVYPLDDRVAERAGSDNHPTVLGDRTYFEFHEGATRLPESSAPDTKNKDHTITAQLTITDNDGDGDVDADDLDSVEGVILANGAITGGYTIYIQDDEDGNKAVFYDYNYFDIDRYSVSVPIELKDGSNQVTVKLLYASTLDEDKCFGCGGTATLVVNGISSSPMSIDPTVPARFGVETQDVGMDLMSPASNNYDSPFEFTGGTIDEIIIDTAPNS